LHVRILKAALVQLQVLALQTPQQLQLAPEQTLLAAVITTAVGAQLDVPQNVRVLQAA
jgi:hypothetical protein